MLLFIDYVNMQLLVHVYIYSLDKELNEVEKDRRVKSRWTPSDLEYVHMEKLFTAQKLARSSMTTIPKSKYAGIGYRMYIIIHVYVRIKIIIVIYTYMYDT